MPHVTTVYRTQLAPFTELGWQRLSYSFGPAQTAFLFIDKRREFLTEAGCVRKRGVDTLGDNCCYGIVRPWEKLRFVLNSPNSAYVISDQ